LPTYIFIILEVTYNWHTFQLKKLNFGRINNFVYSINTSFYMRYRWRGFSILIDAVYHRTNKKIFLVIHYFFKSKCFRTLETRSKSNPNFFRTNPRPRVCCIPTQRPQIWFTNPFENYTIRCRILFCIHHNQLEAYQKSISECQQEKLEFADNFYYVMQTHHEGHAKILYFLDLLYRALVNHEEALRK